MSETPRHLPDAAGPDAPEEVLLRQHLSGRLDPHLGSARRRFAEALAQEQALAMPRRGGSPAAWHWGAGLLLAACMVLGVALWLQMDHGGSRPAAPEGNTLALVSDDDHPRLVPIQYSEVWESRHLGTYVLDGQPVQAVHNQQWQSTRYRNDEGYTVQIDIPVEELVFIDAPLQ